ncbi:MAG: amidohydrolase family protein, partial [Gemmatimonadaceae bacterium]|nr:amidohydrolase family protein [Gemmatimonadaceae bacterium]
RDRAIRALTADAAQLLGVGDRLGTIEAGKIASLTVVRGDLFDASARVVHVMADGELFDVREAPAARGGTGAAGAAAGGAAGRAAADAAASAAANPAAGQWLLTVSLEGKEHRVTVELQQRGEAVSGSFQGALGTGSISNGSIDANGEVRFTAPITTDETQEATFTGTITGNQIRGTVTIVGEAPGTFVGSRPSARQGTRP